MSKNDLETQFSRGLDKGVIVLNWLPKRRIKQLIGNRGPALKIQCAALIQDDSAVIRIATFHKVSLLSCLGHYPFFPMAYLASLGEVMGQSGAVLIRIAMEMVGLEDNLTPLMIEATAVKWCASSPVRPGERVITIATLEDLQLKETPGKVRYTAVVSAEMIRGSIKREAVLRVSGFHYTLAQIPNLRFIVGKLLQGIENISRRRQRHAH